MPDCNISFISVFHNSDSCKSVLPAIECLELVENLNGMRGDKLENVRKNKNG